jgi:hypothetical protein
MGRLTAVNFAQSAETTILFQISDLLIVKVALGGGRKSRATHGDA